MSVKITSIQMSELVLQVTVPLEATMLDSEQSIEQALHEAGVVASGELLQRFDTDGSSIQIGQTKLTSKGLVEKANQTP